MTRNLKALGLALVAVFAMSAFVASAAQAQEPKFTAEEYPVTVHGTGGKALGEAFHAFGSEVQCEVSHFHGELAGASSTITIFAEYTTPCEVVNLKAPAHVTMNECHYVFHATKTSSEGVYKAHVDVVCPGPVKAIGINVTNPAKLGTTLCTITVPEQAGLTEVTLTNNPAEHVDVSGEVTGIEAIIHRESILCPKGTEEAPGTGVNTRVKNATYNIEKPLTLTGLNENGENDGITVSDL